MSGRDEQGVALLTVLLMVAVMAAIAVAVLDDIRFSVRRTANAQTTAQARWYALGAETLARRELAHGAPASVLGVWRSYPVEGGVIRARLDDGGACFNLNSLVEGAPGHWVRREPALVQYRALLTGLGLPAGQALSLSETLTDWIDSDGGRNPSGAEDESYDGYRTAGTLLSEVSELRAVKGYDARAYDLIRPYVCALPVAEMTRLNINILPPERALLLSVVTGGALTPEAARAALAARPVEGWANPQAMPALSQVARTAPLGQLSVQTRWFELTARVDYGGGAALMTSLLEQPGEGPVRLRARRWTADE